VTQKDLIDICKSFFPCGKDCPLTEEANETVGCLQESSRVDACVGDGDICEGLRLLGMSATIFRCRAPVYGTLTVSRYGAIGKDV
jgi:hypothetical protein